MRKTTTWALVVGCAALAGTGATRAQDAEPLATTRGSFVVAAGDKVHGFLRGGETHAILVHLAKGDVYSFSVNSQKRGDPLLMHLTLLDPSGREVNSDARVVHRAGGKKIAVGPYRVPETGQYVIELYAQTWFGGDYWGASKIRAPRRSVVHLPSDGSSVDVNVAAGSTLRLRAKGAIATFAMTTPGGERSTLAGTDPLVASLRAVGLASSETGVYQFGAKGAATLEVTRPAWRAKTVDVPLLPEEPSRLAQFDFVLGWNPRQLPVMPDPAVVATPPSTPIGAPVPVGGATSTGSTLGNATATLFIGGAVTAATDFIEHAPMEDDVTDTPANPGTRLPVPPVMPLVAPPPPPHLSAMPSLHLTDLGIPTTVVVRPTPPDFGCAELIGSPAFLASNGLRAVPWLDRLPGGGPAPYSDGVAMRLLTASGGAVVIAEQDGDDADPFVVRTFDLASASAQWNRVDGRLTTTTRYYVDGHQVAALLATGGDTSITWTVEGSGTIGGATWTLRGSWNLLMHPVRAGDAFRVLHSEKTNGITSCVLSGEERWAADGVEETIAVPEMTLVPHIASNAAALPNIWYFYDPVGRIRNTLRSPDRGLLQTVERNLPPATPFPNTIDRYKHVDVKTITIDPTTPPEGIEADEEFDWFLC